MGPAGICFFCKQPRRRRRIVGLPGSMARSLFPAWDEGVIFPARVCAACLRERPELADAGEAPPHDALDEAAALAV